MRIPWEIRKWTVLGFGSGYIIAKDKYYSSLPRAPLLLNVVPGAETETEKGADSGEGSIVPCLLLFPFLQED